MDLKACSLQETVAAAPAAVFEMFTNSYRLTHWLSDDARVDVRGGGRVYLFWRAGHYATGEFSDVVANEKIVFSWQGRGEKVQSRVSVTFTPDGDGTRIELLHDGIGDGETTYQEIQAGWQNGLANLKSILETGADLRIYNRPFMGILLGGELSAEQAQERGVEGGVLITGTVPGSGAEAAGLLPNDAILSLAGHKILRMADIGGALQGKKLGDHLAVEAHRTSGKVQLNLVLSPRPIPAAPPPPAEFAKNLQTIYQQLDKELEQLLAEVSEEQAELRPAEGEWNAKEVLAHLILTERVVQMIVACQLTYQQLDWPGNHPPVIASLTNTYRTLPELVQVWKNAEKETVNLVANLSAKYLSHKDDYLQLGELLLGGLPNHTRGHYEQIRHAIKTAAAVPA